MKSKRTKPTLRKQQLKHKHKHVILGQLHPDVVAKIAEPMLVVALPRSLWQRIMDWMTERV